MSKFIHTYCEEVLIVNISENRVMYIYARMRKVINIYKIWKKKRKKFLERLTTAVTLPFSSPSTPFLKILDVLCYVISYNLTKFVKIFLFVFIDNVMLSIFVSPHNSLISNTLHVYFSVCYFIPQLKVITYSTSRL